MSGHSKWSKVKHQKAVTDVVKGQAFTKAAHAIAIAVREGGGITDPNANFRLRLAIEKARVVNMPKENITRAIERGKGQASASLASVQYEAYGPGGVAILIEAVTDNRLRTVAAIKNLLDRYSATLATPGAVNFLFRSTGLITVGKDNLSSDKLMSVALDAGAIDLVEKEDVFEIYTQPQELHAIREKLAEQGIKLDHAALIMRPITPLNLENQRPQIDRLIEALEFLEEVQAIYTNLR